MPVAFDDKLYESEMHRQLDIPTVLDDAENVGKFLSPDDDYRLHFVRHGETDDDISNTIRGHQDTSLNQTGIKDAQRAAESLKGKDIKQIVSSSLPRAKQTTRIINNELNVPVQYRDDLRTWDLGAYTGKDDKESHDAVDKLCRVNQDERPPSSSKYPGESFNEFKDRILGAVSNVIQEHGNKKTLVVSHNSPERIIHAWTAAGQPKKKEPEYRGPTLHGPPWFPGELEEDQKVLGAPSNFGKRLDPNLQANQYGPTEAEAVGTKEMMQRAKRDRTLTIDFPDAFPQSQMQTDLGLDEIGDFDPFLYGLNQSELATRARHKEGDLAGKLGIYDMGNEDRMDAALERLKQRLKEIKDERQDRDKQ